jgi:hypothetical protein
MCFRSEANFTLKCNHFDSYLTSCYNLDRRAAKADI